MDKNQLVYSLQSARWRSVLGQKPPLLAPWEKGLSEALACPGTLDADDLEAAVRAAFEKYLQFDGTPHKNHHSAFISAISGRRCSPSSCRSRSSAPTS